MFDAIPQALPITTGNPKIDGAINAGLVIASAGLTVFAYFKGQRQQKARRTPAKRHTPAPLPRTAASKELDALNERG